MNRLCVGLLAVFLAGSGAAAEATMTAEQIVERNVAARGGLDAWRNVQTMIWVGHVETANGPGSGMPFVLDQKRPNKTRFEIKAQNQMSVRTFDGENGWKLRPSATGTPEVQPFSKAEINFARDGQGLDGPLVDYAAKGIAIDLDGIEEVEGRRAYRLSVRLPSGASHHVWVDAETYLDFKYDRQSKNALGQTTTTAVIFRDFKTVDGVQIPMAIETSADGTTAGDRMVIDRVAVNAPLDDRKFGRPQLPGRHHGATVDTRSAGRPGGQGAWQQRPLSSMLPPAAGGR